jgi:hypothetical protein
MLVGFAGVVVGPATVAVLFTDEGLRWTFLRIFAVVLLAGFPAFLLARFVFSRVGAIWEDFVLNLYRLKMDEPRYLPEPLFASVYHQFWYEDGGPALRWADSIYERKFQVAYGAIPRATETSKMLAPGKALPAYLATFVLAVLWTAVLWGAAPLDASARILMTPGAVAFGFLGAYAFSVQMLIRRYFQSDLRPLAFTGVLARLLFVLVVSYAIHQAFAAHWPPGAEAATLFLVGFFPSTALQVLRVGVAKSLRAIRLPNMASDYPLSDLDGMSIWYEARLLEVGIEDMQNLATANLVDVLLSTRVPVARLVDWIDQAVLYLSMAPVRSAPEPAESPGPTTAKGQPNAAERARYRLRTHGIRTATDVENLFRAQDAQHIQGLSSLLSCTDGLNVLEAIRTGVANEPNLAHVRSWKRVESRFAPTST